MEPGIKKLTEAVKRDCREGQGCFNPNGCDHEFIRHVPETDPSMIRLGQKTKCIKVSNAPTSIAISTSGFSIEPKNMPRYWE